MSSLQREIEAQRELDRAEERLLALSKSSKDALDAFRNLYGTTTTGIGLKYEDFINTGGGLAYAFVISASGKAMIDFTKGEDFQKIGLSTMADLAVEVVAFAIRQSPYGRILTMANWAASQVGFDFGSITKKLYDWANNIPSDDDIKIINNSILQVTMPNGEVYARPLIDTGSKFSLFGDGKDDVLFGGNGDDILQGRYGDDLLLGGNGYDTYFADGKDIIRDDDGKGQVYFHGRKLTDATQIEKGSNIYKTKDNIKYEVVDNKLIVNDSLVIENFNPYTDKYLDIKLLEADEISVTINDNSAVEKAGSMSFDINLSRDLKENEFVKVSVNEKTYMFMHPSNPNYTVGTTDTEYVFGSSTTYTYTWSDDENVEKDEEFDLTPNIIETSQGLKAIPFSGHGTIIDDDDDPDNPNDTFPDTDPASTKTSPIVIDLNNDGVKTISRKDNKIYFDLDNNKFAQNTAWIDSNDGILINKALITDNNITNGSQLFGNHTLLTNGNLAINGFEALKEFDENNDGVINELDQNAYENLAIWQDVNSNAKLDNNELKSLKELGIKEINLNYTNSSFIDENGNEHRQTSSVVFENGNKANISDVWLDNHTADTKYVGEKISLSNEIRALPQIYAFGEVLNLRQAMAQDEVLKTNLNLLVA